MNGLQYNKISATSFTEKNTISVFIFTSISIKRFTRSYIFLWSDGLDKTNCVRKLAILKGHPVYTTKW